jgi:Flp pilus assembly pilin Flp
MIMLQQIANWMKGLKTQNGQALLEYALILCLVVLVVGFSLVFFGELIVEIFVHIYTVIIGWCGCM